MTKPSLCCLCKYFFFFSHLSFAFSFIRESFSLPWSYFVTVRFTEIDFRLKRRCMKRRRRRFCDVSILPAKQMSTSDAFSAFFVFPAVRSFFHSIASLKSFVQISFRGHDSSESQRWRKSFGHFYRRQHFSRIATNQTFFHFLSQDRRRKLSWMA